MRKHIQPEAWKTLESSFLGLRFGWRSRVSHSLSLDNNSSQLCWKEGSVQIWAGIEFTDLMSKVLGNGNKYIPYLLVTFSSVQLLSHVWLCNPMACSTPGLPVYHQLPEFTQTYAHWVSDAIQPSHPLSSPSAFNLSQHQSLFQWVSSSHWVAKILELQLQHQSFQWIFRTDFL